MRTRKSEPVQRNIALAYIRLSNAPRIEKDDAKNKQRLASRERNKNRRPHYDVINDLDSPERQRANIETICAKRGLKIEWYQDVDGHRSGTTEKNRPGWLALKKRLTDPDVAALVANDLSRLHRKSARVSDLLDLLEENKVDLILAAPGREVDTSTPMGQMFAMMAAMFDEYYARDISARAKDSIAHRKEMGKAINLPFGTQRATDGYLEPAEDGAWLMPDGHHEPGYADDPPPDEAALWRGYYDCAQRLLELYTENKLGMERMAYTLNLEGWAFRDRAEMPRPIDKEDIRRVVHNWPEYGGLVLGGHALHRSVQNVNADTVMLLPERSVFPVDLLMNVARVLRERAYEPRNDGVKRSSRVYALQGMLYCAQCEARAIEQDNPGLRSRLWGKTAKDSRYFHQPGIKGCGCTNRSVICIEVEDDISHLLQMMCVREDIVQRMIAQVSNVGTESSNEKSFESLETRNKNALARLQRRLQAAKRLFRDGDMEEAEYDAIVRETDDEVESWQRMTNEQAKVEYEMRSAVEMLTKLSSVWNAGNAEHRQSLIRSLFAHIVYDLDTRRIVDFKLKPWVDRFIELRIQTENVPLNQVSVLRSRGALGTTDYTTIQRLYRILMNALKQSCYGYIRNWRYVHHKNTCTFKMCATTKLCGVTFLESQ